MASASSWAGGTLGSLRFQHLSLLSRRRSSSASPATRNELWGSLGLHVLHNPPDPHVEIVFVDGLRGGSIKTWCEGDNLQLFWPREWLPQEPELQHARIHSFGYNADWPDSRESELDLHDFGRSLPAGLNTSPSLRQKRSVSTPPSFEGYFLGSHRLADTNHLGRALDARTCHQKGQYACSENTLYH